MVADLAGIRQRQHVPGWLEFPSVGQIPDAMGYTVGCWVLLAWAHYGTFQMKNGIGSFQSTRSQAIRTLCAIVHGARAHGHGAAAL
jgi:choline-glycine betaine transporter